VPMQRARRAARRLFDTVMRAFRWAKKSV
jgi:hypothetical protein